MGSLSNPNLDFIKTVPTHRHRKIRIFPHTKTSRENLRTFKRGDVTRVGIYTGELVLNTWLVFIIW